MAPAEILATGKPLLLTGYNQERFAEHTYFESLGVFLCHALPAARPGSAVRLFWRSEADGGTPSPNATWRWPKQIGFHLSHAIANLSAYDQIRQLKDQLEQEKCLSA
jgi:hypothetical protein